MRIKSDTYDLIIVGCGAAGLSAGISYIEKARQNGRHPRIAILESASYEDRGGATHWTTSRFRVRKDYTLDPSFIDKMRKVSGGLFDIEYCRALEAETPNTIRFLEAHGVKLIHYPPLLAMDVEHEMAPDGGGRAIVDALSKTIEQADSAEILYLTEAVRLSLSPDGRVEGVVVREPDGLLRTLGGRAVVLACGGFEGNQEMLTRYIGSNACDLKLLAPGLAYNQGTGLRMAMEIGAATSGQFDMIHSELVDSRSGIPDAFIYAHPFGIVINGDGKRFYDEGQGTFEETFELIAYEVWRNQKQKAFFIADQTIADNVGIKLLFGTDKPPIEARTVTELATTLGLEPMQLEKTINEFNATVGRGEFDPSRRDGKRTTGLVPPKSNWAYRLEKPPFIAYPMTTAICFTYGGIRTDAKARVLSDNGSAIPGLYAAGEIVGMYYHEYPAGTSVLRSLTFGRLAGAEAAETSNAK